LLEVAPWQALAGPSGRVHYGRAPPAGTCGAGAGATTPTGRSAWACPRPRRPASRPSWRIRAHRARVRTRVPGLAAGELAQLRQP
ncbi:unnamed protein product, partial [Prorocentrum cordatum]